MITNFALNESRTNLGDEARRKRVSIGVSKSELSRATGLHRDTINDIENSTGDIRLSSLLIYNAGIEHFITELAYQSGR
jgi:transcriptional regulator with XRE-family HTH domain